MVTETDQPRKNPFQPKPPLTAYLLFADDKRKAMKDEHPEMKFGNRKLYSNILCFNIKIGQISKLLTEQWKVMSDKEKKVDFTSAWITCN